MKFGVGTVGGSPSSHRPVSAPNLEEPQPPMRRRPAPNMNTTEGSRNTRPVSAAALRKDKYGIPA